MSKSLPADAERVYIKLKALVRHRRKLWAIAFGTEPEPKDIGVPTDEIMYTLKMKQTYTLKQLRMLVDFGLARQYIVKRGHARWYTSDASIPEKRRAQKEWEKQNEIE